MKKFICGLLVGIMLTMGVTTYAVPEIKSALFSDIRLVVNGEILDTQIVSVTTSDNPNYMTNYVPARALAESLGATVEWDGANRTINVDTEAAAVSLTSAQAPVQTSSEVKLPEKVIVNGYEYVWPSETYYALQAKGYELMNDANNEYLQIVKDNKIVLKDIPTNARGGKFYIPYSFYETNILPLLQ